MCHAAALVAGVARIIYAAPKELVPDLGVPFPQVVAEMQVAWRRVGTDEVAHVPTPGAAEPFTRFRARAGETR
jgi:guanine deaminase